MFGIPRHQKVYMADVALVSCPQPAGASAANASRMPNFWQRTRFSAARSGARSAADAAPKDGLRAGSQHCACALLPSASRVRGATFRSRALSFANTCSIGLKSDWRRQGKQGGTNRFDGRSDARPVVAGQIVHDHGVAPAQLWDEQPLGPGLEDIPIDRAIDDEMATIPSSVIPAISVVIFQCPCGTLMRSLSPRGHLP